MITIHDQGMSWQNGTLVPAEKTQAGVEATKAMIATKGRASYLGERSIGHQDPGATSFTLLLGVITEFCG